MNGVNENQTTQNTTAPSTEPVITNVTPAPATNVQKTTPAQPQQSLGSNVVIAPPSSAPIDASTDPTMAAHKTPTFVQPAPAPSAPVLTPEPPKEPETNTQETTPPEEPPKEEVVEVPKKRSGIGFILIIILILIGLNVYQYLESQAKVQKLQFECTPVTTYDTEKELDLKSTIVRDLYNKVKTNIREDLAHNTFDDELKRYLAFRQIPNGDFYDSNCNLFDNTKMQLYTCPTNENYHPLAFKVETFEREYKKLFGANTQVPHGNIQLSNKCFGGYQYIEGRGEYVQGKCAENVPTSFKTVKTLTKAISRNNTIILTEEVVYKGTDTLKVPEYLKNGTYTYTFKLDINYNYVYVTKDFTPKY